MMRSSQGSTIDMNDSMMLHVDMAATASQCNRQGSRNQARRIKHF